MSGRRRYRRLPARRAGPSLPQLARKTGVPGMARMQFRNTSCASTSGNGPPVAVSALSHAVTDAPTAAHKSAAPRPTRPNAPMTRTRGGGQPCQRLRHSRNHSRLIGKSGHRGNRPRHAPARHRPEATPPPRQTRPNTQRRQPDAQNRLSGIPDHRAPRRRPETGATGLVRRAAP